MFIHLKLCLNQAIHSSSEWKLFRSVTSHILQLWYIFHIEMMGGGGFQVIVKHTRHQFWYHATTVPGRSTMFLSVEPLQITIFSKLPFVFNEIIHFSVRLQNRWYRDDFRCLIPLLLDQLSTDALHNSVRRLLEDHIEASNAVLVH